MRKSFQLRMKFLQSVPRNANMKKRPTPTIFSSITGENLRNQSIWGIWLYFNVLKALHKYKNSLTMTSLKFLTLTIPNIEILLMNGSLGPWLRSSWQKVHKNSNKKNFSGCWDYFIEVNSQLKDKNMKSIWMWKSTLKICFVLKFFALSLIDFPLGILISF